jgi:hypothetical protein
MPKENTHLWFASTLLEEIRDRSMLEALRSGMSFYRLGSFIPDTCYYNSSIDRISLTLHGQTGLRTNLMILSVLDRARGMDDIAFILGYITHCALDITFHPMIDALSGDYYDRDPVVRENAQFRHRLLETCIDLKLGHTLRVYRLARPRLLRGLAFEDIVSREFSVPAATLEATLRKQLLFNRAFASPAAYRLAVRLHSLGILRSLSLLGLFYECARLDPDCIQDPISYTNPYTGEKFTESLSALFARARAKALPMMEAAWGFSEGKVSGEELVKLIPGENLSTGLLP